MAELLVIADDISANVVLEQVMSWEQISATHMSPEALLPESVISNQYDLIIFDMAGQYRACMVILEQLERWVETSGIKLPPLIVLTEDRSEQVEPIARSSSVDFLFIYPVNEEKLKDTVRHALAHQFT